MATALNTKVPELIDNTWENQSPVDRLHSIEKMQASGHAGQAALIYIAHNDEHTQVRCGAIRLIEDIPSLLALKKGEAEVAEAATQQFHRILAGTVQGAATDNERLAIIASLPEQALKQIALLTKDKATGTAAVEGIGIAEELADLSLFAASANVRKLAAMKIDDRKLLAEIREKVRDKDKSVFKLIDQRLAASESKKKARTQQVEEENTATNAEETAVVTPHPALAATEAESTPPTAPVVAEMPSDAQPIAAETAADSVAVESTETSETSIKKKPKKNKKAAPVVVLDPLVELPRLQQQLEKLSHKHTDALNALRNNLNKLRKTLSEAPAEIAQQAADMHGILSAKLEKNHLHQEHLQQATEALLEQLKQALDAGQSHDALPTWDKIQGNISNTSGKIRAAMQKQANVYKAKLNELRDWKSFAATEKKKELIIQMQHLLDSKMHAADRSKHISKMHQEWKSLGRSNQNEQLWREFKKLSDQAYEPCKEYFKQRKQLMAGNLTKRREICEMLEGELAKIGEATELRISELNKLLHQAEQDWKVHAPIEQSRLKSMQKRYYGAVNKLRKTRKHTLREHGNQKQEFINQANALVELADRQHAMSEAKRLQQEWKKIGPTSFKDDKKYWEDFRAACDKIFEKRNQEMSAQRDSLKQSEGKLADLLHAMEAIFALDDENFRASRSQFQDLAQQFSNELDPRLRQQTKRLQEQFNGLKRKIDARFKALPDKKQLQLKNSVLEKARFLQQLEDTLLACKEDAEFLATKQQFDNAAWEQLAASGDEKYDQALSERLQRILQTDSADALRNAAAESEAKARALCIELEIRANIDTPKEDQDLRMQIQLDQLKNGFGKLKPDRKENSSYAMDVELQSYCLGPLESKIQQRLAQRLEGAIKKLL